MTLSTRGKITHKNRKSIINDKSVHGVGWECRESVFKLKKMREKQI